MDSVTSDRPVLYHEVIGEGGVPILLIHPAGATSSTWGSLPQELARVGRVITYDRRGFGRSSKPGVGYNYDTFAADLDKLLKKLNLKKVALVGFSMGSGEVTRYIGNYGTARVRNQRYPPAAVRSR